MSPRRPIVCASPADWRRLAERARDCARLAQAEGVNAGGAAAGCLSAGVDLTLLAGSLRGALTGVFQQRAGWSAYQAAGGFLELARAFAHPDTAPQRRAALAPAVEHAAAFVLGVLDEISPGPRERADIDG